MNNSFLSDEVATERKLEFSFIFDCFTQKEIVKSLYPNNILLLNSKTFMELSSGKFKQP